MNNLSITGLRDVPRPIEDHDPGDEDNTDAKVFSVLVDGKVVHATEVPDDWDNWKPAGKGLTHRPCQGHPHPTISGSVTFACDGTC